jgi:multidrug efflux pump subunit AcrA (membrane-fusion protein)
MGLPVKAGAAVLLLLLAVSACRRESEPRGASPAGAAASLPTPVKVVPAERTTLSVFVSGPGKTAALAQQKVRAPFAGTLVALTVSEGDSVRHGQTVGSVLARESEAALSGAREMLRQASTDDERKDAQRAVALAEQNLVRRPLVATADGSVLSHAASAGDRVSEDQEILTISEAGSVVFVAEIPQSDLSRIRAGQEAAVELAGLPKSAPGVVHSVLAGANPADFTGEVRIDLRRADGNVPTGLFGTARIRVAERQDAVVVADAAILRDDVSGISRICLAVGGKAHWIDVVAGVKEGGRTQIVSPALTPGQPVIVSGLVGLPEGKPVSIESK